MPRSIWTGAISFGLVTVPVKLYSAVSRKTVRFNQLNKKTGSRIQQQRVDASTGEEVAYEDLVKGYEISPDRYVVIDPSELDAVEPRRTKTIEIEDFVDLDDIDPIFYDHPYYLAPAAGGAKPYRLLLEAMRETSKVAIAKVVIRSKESLVAIRPMGDVLEMATMLFADEVVDPQRLDDVPDPDDVATSERELAIAKQLVESLAGDFRAREVPRHLPRGRPRDDRAQGRRRGNRLRARTRGGGAGARPHERPEGEPRRRPRAHRRRRRVEQAEAPARHRLVGSRAAAKPRR